MKAGWNNLLQQAVRSVPMFARVVVEAQVVARNADNTEQADIRQQLADWQNLDSQPSNVDLLPNGSVRLRPTANNGPISTAITAEARMIGDAGATAPFINPLSNNDSNTRLAAWVEWNPNDGPPTGELMQLLLSLDPQTDPSIPMNVASWELELYAVTSLGGGSALSLVPLLPLPLVVAVPSSQAGFVLWDFTPWFVRPRPKLTKTTTGLKSAGLIDGWAHTLVLVTGRQQNKAPASNIGWGYDGAHASASSAGGSTLYGALIKQFSPAVFAGFSGTCPAAQFIVGTHTPATVTFSDGGGHVNHLDLKSVPAVAPELIVRADTPPDTTVQAQVLADDGVTWKTYTDGDLVASTNAGVGRSGNDLTAVGIRQTYKVRATLTQNPAGDRSPVLTALGARVVTITDLSDVCEVTGLTQAVDPQDLHAEVPEIVLRAIHDGERDFRDAITRLLSNNPLGNIVFRTWIGHPKLSRGLWLHHDDWFIDDYDLAGPHVTLRCLSPLALVRGVLPVLTSEQDFYPSSDNGNPGGWTKSGGVTVSFASLLADNNGAGSLGTPWRDITYAQSPSSPSNADLIVNLPPIGIPNANFGPNLNLVVQFRYRLATATGLGGLIVTLFKSGIAVASTGFLPVSSTQTSAGTLPLTAAQVAALGDGTNLTLQFRADSGFGGLFTVPVQVTWARLAVLALRPALVYTAPTSVGVVATDLLNNQIALDPRYRGPGIPDTVPPVTVGKTIAAAASGVTPDLLVAKNEIDAIGYIAGGAWISSQGRVKFVPFFDPGTPQVDPGTGLSYLSYAVHGAAPVAFIPREEIGEPIAVTPGYRYRVPLFDVWWGWQEATQSWGVPGLGGTGGEAHGVALAALTALGPARLMANVQLSDRIAKWIQTQGLAQGLANRQVDTLGLGQLTWRFRTTYAHPELELGDLISIETDRFIAYDPAAARALAGARVVTGFVVGIYDVWGRDLCIWVPGHAGATTQLSSQPPAPNPSKLGVTVQATPRAGGFLNVSWSGGPAVKSVRVAWSSLATGGNAPPMSGLEPGERLILGAESISAGGNAIVGTPGGPFAQPGVDVSALGVTPSRMVGGASAPGAPPAGSGVVLVGQSGKTQIGPFAFGDTVFVTVTPYATIDGTGAPGPAVSTQVQLEADSGENDPGTGLRPRFQPLLDGKYALRTPLPDGSTNTSEMLNPQGSLVPNPSNVNSGTWAYNSGGAVSPHMWISWNWITFTMWRPDGTTISVLGSGAIPSPAVSLSQVAGGALGARTRFVRIALVKDGLLYMGTTNTEQSLAVSANNLLQVASPAAVAGFDGWTPLVGSASDGEFTQPGLIYTPLAFGSAWTEPVGGASVAGTTPYNSAWGSHGVNGGVTAVELVQNTTYNFYPAWSLAMGLVRFCCATGAGPSGPDPASAALQNSDGVYGLTNFTAMTAVTLAAGTPGSGNGGAGGTTSKYK